MIDRSVHVRKVADGALSFWARATANWRRTFRLPPPAAFQLIKRGIKFAPLAAREKAPFQRILQPIIVFAFAAASQLCSGALNVQTVEDRMMPDPIISALANRLIELAPVLF